jgi:DNA-binding winged helix-turn-helix (wHTH) protein
MYASYDTSQLPRHALDQDGSPIIVDRERPAATAGALEFGRFRLSVRQRQLFADGVPVELGTRAFDILMVLIEAGGALVTHDELQRRVWPGIVVARDNLKVQISALRKALGEDRELIHTDNGRGYRFTAAVRASVAARECWFSGARRSSGGRRPRYYVGYACRRNRRRRPIGSISRGTALLEKPFDTAF